MKKAFFMAHGAPTIIFDDNPFTQTLKNFKQDYPEITKLVVMSAHFESKIIRVSTSADYDTMYDFSGFPQKLYEVKMQTKGDPDLGQKVIDLLKQANLNVSAIQNRPLDHGAWTLLKLIDPDNTMKVVLMSVDPFEDPTQLMKIGQALKGLDDSTAFIFSGGLVHNLGWLSFDDHIQPQAVRFWTWLDASIQAQDTTALLNYQSNQDAHLAVPRPEHFSGLFCVYGTMEGKGSVKLLSHLFQYGTLSLDYYAFTND